MAQASVMPRQSEGDADDVCTNHVVLGTRRRRQAPRNGAPLRGFGALTGRRDRANSAAIPSMPPCRHPTTKQERLHRFGRGVDTSPLPERGPDAGTMDQVRPRHRSLAPTTQNLRLVDLSSLTPSGGGLRADPVQKHDPGERISRKWKREYVERGIDKLRPVTEASAQLPATSCLGGFWTPAASKNKHKRRHALIR
jgi:hypothetical protein